MEVIDVLQKISAYLGLDFGSLTAIAISVTVVVNFFKSTKPFSNLINGNVVPYFTALLSLGVSAVTMWGNWVSMFLSALLITILSIGGWASAKKIAHKIGKEPSNHSGGM